MHNGSRIQSKHTVSLMGSTPLIAFNHRIADLLSNTTMELARIKALGPEGLIELSNEEQWVKFNMEVRVNEWMDGEVKVLAEVRKRKN
jgi:hypothetical protein